MQQDKSHASYLLTFNWSSLDVSSFWYFGLERIQNQHHTLMQMSLRCLTSNNSFVFTLNTWLFWYQLVLILYYILCDGFSMLVKLNWIPKLLASVKFLYSQHLGNYIKRTLLLGGFLVCFVGVFSVLHTLLRSLDYYCSRQYFRIWNDTPAWKLIGYLVSDNEWKVKFIWLYQCKELSQIKCSQLS